VYSYNDKKIKKSDIFSKVLKQNPELAPYIGEEELWQK
jgi:hypothetical protein